MVDMPVHGEHAGAARVRRERKLRSFWRHEQMAIQMVLASVQHHSHGVLRNQRTATRTGREARDAPLPQGGRPAPLPELAGWQERVQRHTAEHIVDVLPYLQILDVPVPQMREQLVDILRLVDMQTPVEQVIEVTRSRPHPAALPRCSVRRRWRNCWWKCPPLCLFPHSSSRLRSRLLTFQFLVFVVFIQDVARCCVLWNRTWAFQFLMVVVVSVEEVFKVYAQNRVLQRLPSRTFPLQFRVVEVPVVDFKVFLPDRTPHSVLWSRSSSSGSSSQSWFSPRTGFAAHSGADH